MQTQLEWVLNELRSGRKLTQLAALADFGIGRLARVVGDLKKQGHDVRSNLVTRTKANGQAVQVAEYSLPAVEVQGELGL